MNKVVIHSKMKNSINTYRTYFAPEYHLYVGLLMVSVWVCQTDWDRQLEKTGKILNNPYSPVNINDTDGVWNRRNRLIKISPMVIDYYMFAQQVKRSRVNNLNFFVNRETCQYRLIISRR